MAAAQLILLRQMSGSREKWASLEGLTLTAACVFFVNCLNSRPDDSAEAIDLRQAILPAAHLADEDIFAIDLASEFAPVERHNLFFMRQISLHDGAYLANGRLPQHKTLAKLFDAKTIMEVQSKIRGISDWQPKRRIDNPTFIPNKMAKTGAVDFVTDDNVTDFRENDNVRLPTRTLVHADGYMDDEDGNASVQGTNAELQQILNQMFNDLVEKGANKRLQQTYWLLTPEERLENPREVFKMKDIQNVLSEFAVIGLGPKQKKETWEIAKKSLFPGPSETIYACSQGWKNMLYFDHYMTMKKGFENKGEQSKIIAIQKQFHDVLDTLVWLPAAKKDKPWPTSSSKGTFVSKTKPNERRPAALLALNPKFPHTLYNIQNDIRDQHMNADS